MSQFRAGLATISRELTKANAPAGRTMAKALRTDSRAVPMGAMSGEQFMRKALSANRDGRLSAAEVSEIERAIARGQQPRGELVKAVMLDTPIGLRGEHDATFAKLRANLGPMVMAKAERLDMSADAAQPGRVAPSERPKIGDMPSDHFLAMALKANREGNVTATDIATIEACVNAGKEPPARLVRAVVNGEKPELWG